MAGPVAPADLIGAWLHSREEDTESGTVYRRKSYRFPPSRGRKGFELNTDHTVTEIGYGPTDRPTGTPGTWRISGRRLEFTTADGSGTRSLEIESISPERIVIRKPRP
jgi:hypothetical protein